MRPCTSGYRSATSSSPTSDRWLAKVNNKPSPNNGNVRSRNGRPIDAPFPPAPWHLRGWGIATLQAVDVRAARTFIPADCNIISVAPGKTVGGLLFLSYESGSTLEYHELNVVAGLVRVGLRVAFYLARLYVDSPAAIAGGRAIWGVPKLSASFNIETVDSRRTVIVSKDGSDICRLRSTKTPTRLRVPLPMPALGTRATTFLFFTGRLRANVGMAATTVEPARDSDIAALGLDRPLVSFSLDACELIVPAPTAVRRQRCGVAGHRMVRELPR